MTWRSTSRCLVPFGVLVALLALARPAVAAEPTPGPVKAPAPAAAPRPAQLAEAQAAFQRGQRALAAGDFSLAIEEFRRAAATKNTPGLHFFIAYCLEQMGLLVEAAAEYDEAETLLATYPAPDVVSLLPEARQRLEQNTPSVVIEKLTPGASVELDGRVVQTSRPIAVNPGTHRISIRAPGHEAIDREFEVAVGARTSISGHLSPFPTLPPAATSVPETRASPAKSATFWTAAGFGVAGLATGIVGIVWRADAEADVERHGQEVDDISGGSDSACSGQSAPAACEDLQGALDARSAATTTEWLGFGAAAAGGLTALATHLLWPDVPVHVDAGPSPMGGAAGLLRVSAEF